MKGLPNILLILTAFSACVVYMFSAFLLEQNYIEEIVVENSPFRPSEDQILMARRLNLEHRVRSTARDENST